MWNRFCEIVRFREIGRDFAKSYDFAKSLTQNRNREKNDFAKSLTPKPISRNQWNDSKTNNIVSILSKIFTISYLFCREIQKLFSSLWSMFSIQMYLTRSSLYSCTVQKVGRYKYSASTSTVLSTGAMLVSCKSQSPVGLYSYSTSYCTYARTVLVRITYCTCTYCSCTVFSNQ